MIAGAATTGRFDWEVGSFAGRSASALVDAARQQQQSRSFRSRFRRASRVCCAEQVRSAEQVRQVSRRLSFRIHIRHLVATSPPEMRQWQRRGSGCTSTVISAGEAATRCLIRIQSNNFLDASVKPEQARERESTGRGGKQGP